GIGEATARRLARAGARLALHGRDRACLDALAGDIGGMVVTADLCIPAAAAEAAAKAEAELGPLDVVVSNAGVGWAGDFTTMEPGDIDRLLAVNLAAPTHLARATLPGMVERGRGHLVLVGSIAGHLGVRGEAVYSAAKAGVVGLAGALATEVGPSGVAVSLVSPGVVDTAFFEHRGRPYGRTRPRPIPPERVAEAVEEALRTGRPRALVPSWLEVPVALSVLAPGLYRRLTARYG
ncbi:MAG: SDR family NAD(P)-dependent oxidoreductase, partial [Acidimicrobiales bacterium]